MSTKQLDTRLFGGTAREAARLANRLTRRDGPYRPVLVDTAITVDQARGLIEYGLAIGEVRGHRANDGIFADCVRVFPVDGGRGLTCVRVGPAMRRRTKRS